VSHSGLSAESVEPLLPEVKTGGRPEKHPRRALVDAILYVVRTGCACSRAETPNRAPG
jgi:transposase